jgi:hypothetical protein
VNPHRRAIGAEQPVGADAEDVEAGRQIERRSEARGELVEQLAHVALQLLRLTQVQQLERGDERVGDFHPRVFHAARRRRRVKPDRQQSDAIRSANQRQQQCGPRA